MSHDMRGRDTCGYLIGGCPGDALGEVRCEQCGDNILDGPVLRCRCLCPNCMCMCMCMCM